MMEKLKISSNDFSNDFAITQGLKGIMTWDANIDSMGIDNNAPYAYCMGIQSELNKGSYIKQCCNIN